MFALPDDEAGFHPITLTQARPRLGRRAQVGDDPDPLLLHAQRRQLGEPHRLHGSGHPFQRLLAPPAFQHDRCARPDTHRVRRQYIYRHLQGARIADLQQRRPRHHNALTFARAGEHLPVHWGADDDGFPRRATRLRRRMPQCSFSCLHFIPCYFYREPGGTQLGLGLPGAGFGAVALGFGHDAFLLAQRRHALELQPGVIGFRLRGGSGLLGGVQGGFGGGYSRFGLGLPARIEHFRGQRIQRRQRLAAPDGVAHLQFDAAQSAAHRRVKHVAIHDPGFAFRLDRHLQRPASDDRCLHPHRLGPEAIGQRGDNRQGQQNQSDASTHDQGSIAGLEDGDQVQAIQLAPRQQPGEERRNQHHRGRKGVGGRMDDQWDAVQF